MRKIKLIAACIVILCSLAVVSSSHCVNYCDGARAPEGFYLATYPVWYTADSLTNDDGGTATNEFGANEYDVLIRPIWYIRDFVFHVIVPLGNISVHYFDDNDGGIGDIVAGGGYFLPVKEINILPVLNMKFPTGHFNSASEVNYGDGQFDLMPELYINKSVGRCSVDIALKYWHRFRNENNSFTPGNQFYAECVSTYEVIKGFRVGPNISFCKGGNPELEGVELPDNDITRLSVGAEFVFIITPKVHFLLDAIPDVYAENTAKGMLVMGRLCCKF